MKQILHLLKREFKLFFTNTTLLSVFFAAPLFYALLLGFTYQKGKVESLPVILVNQDQTPLSNQLVDMLQDNQTLNILNYINEPADIKSEVIAKEAAAVIVISTGFEKGILQKKYPEVNVFINTANVLTANFASKAIQLTLGTFAAGIEIQTLQKKGMNAEMAKTQYEPFKANYITLFNTTGNYLIFMWPAMMAVVLQQVILLAMAVSFSSDFKRRTFLTEFKGKEKHASLIMMIKGLPIWLFSFLNIFVFYLLSAYFMIPVPANVMNFFLLTTVFIFSSANLGVLVSVLVPDALKATQVLMVIASPAFIVSGFTWPVSAMPDAIRYFTAIIPLTPYLEALKITLIQKGESYLTMQYFWHLLILMVVYFILGWLALKIKLNRMYRQYHRPATQLSENLITEIEVDNEEEEEEEV